MHLFNYELGSPNRQTTKSQWKEVQRFLRVCRNRVEKKVKPTIETALLDLMLHGSAIITP